MVDLIIRPLVAGEENLFESMPDPLPQLRQIGYADGIASGGYKPENTWVAVRAGRVVARAAWVHLPGAVGKPPLPATSGRYTLRPPVDAAEINALVARVAEPDVLTGKETALAVYGVDAATDPLAWLTGPLEEWRIAFDAGEPVGLVGTAGDACYPLMAYLGLLDEAVRSELLVEAVRVLADGGAQEVVADVDSYRVAVLSELERTGFRQVRSRVVFAPAAD